MNRPVRWATASLLLWCVGCGGGYEVVRVVNPASMRSESWVGEPRARLEERWGRPTKIDRESDGTEVLIYRHVIYTDVEDEIGPQEPAGRDAAPVAVEPVPRSPGNVKRTVEQRTRDVARFWLAADGSVAREWIDIDLLRKLRKRHGGSLRWFHGDGELVPGAAERRDGD